MKKGIKVALFALCIIIALFAAGGFIFTPETDNLIESEADGTIPFSSQSQIHCNYYRIPSVITTNDGVIIAGADARFGSTKDSPNNIDTIISTSTDNGQSWDSPSLALSFNDWENSSKILKANGKLTTKNSASAIDSALLQDNETGRIFLIADVFPCKTGAVNAEKGSGYMEVDGEKCLMLKKSGEKDYNYYADGSGIIFNIDGEKTQYSLNENFEIYENSTPLTVKQKEQIFWYNLSFGVNTKTEVPMNIMYNGALFKPLATSYLYLIYSDDNGKTWSAPVNLNSCVKSDDADFMGICPGRGIQIEKGKYEGRLIFSAYYRDTQTGEQKFTAIFSDDHGESWSVGNPVQLSEEINNLSETQLVQFSDGSLQSFSRSTIGKVVSSFSTDGGVTWSKPFAIDELPLSGGSGCQLSVINYKGKIDGKDAVILSAPAGDNRKNGTIYVGLINESKDSGAPYEIQWKYKKEITDKDTDFAYSCLTQMPNGNIGLLYEASNAPQAADAIVFKSYQAEELCRNS